MSNPPQALRVTLSAAVLRSEPGPPVPHYRLVLDRSADPWRFAPGSTSTEDSFTTIVPTGGGYAGAWLRCREDDQGEDITATDTLVVGGGRWRRIAVGALSANATLTLSVTNAVAGDWIEVTRLDVGAYTVAFINAGPAAGTLTTMPVSARARVVVYFDGTDWLLRDAHAML